MEDLVVMAAQVPAVVLLLLGQVVEVVLVVIIIQPDRAQLAVLVRSA
jgi:hypothetical protein